MRAGLQRLRDGLRIEGRILVLFLISALLLFGFAKLASEVIEGDTVAFDRYLLTALRSAADPSVPVGPKWLNTAMLDITALGGVSVLTVVTAIVIGYLLVAKKAATAFFVFVAVTGGAAASTLLKMGYARPRPDLVAHLVQVNTTSFPSGHAMNSALVFLTLGALLARSVADRRLRVYFIVVAIALTLIIGCSRVFLGVHWPSDVLAGWMVGGAWAMLCSVVARQLQMHRTIEPVSLTPPAA